MYMDVIYVMLVDELVVKMFIMVIMVVVLGIYDFKCFVC